MCGTQTSTIGGGALPSSVTGQAFGDVQESAIYSIPEGSVDLIKSKLAGKLGAGQDSSGTLHFTPVGDFFLSSTTPLRLDGLESGSIAQVSVWGGNTVTGVTKSLSVENIHLPSLGDGQSGGELRLTLNMEDLGTLLSDGSVDLRFRVNHNSVMLESAEPTPEARELASTAGISMATVWCIARHGGSAILPVLRDNLALLATGPAAFLAAVVAGLPQAAVQTVQGVVKDCF